MTKSSKGPPPIVYIVLALLLLGGGYWLWSQRDRLGKFLGRGDNSGVSVDPTGSGGSDNAATAPVDTRISAGGKELFPPNALGASNSVAFDATKQQGLQALGQGNYSAAVQAFESTLDIYRNDPESLIYLNNASIGDGPAYTAAVSVPIGPNTTPYALEMLRGFAHAQNEINQAGGINGTPLKLLIVDDDDDPAVAQQVVSELANNPEVLAVMGHWSSGTTLGVAPVYDQQNLVLINPVSTSTEISGISDYVFRTIPNNAVIGRTMADYILNQNQTRAAVFYDSSSAYSESLKAEFVSAVSARGGQITREVDLRSDGFQPGQILQDLIDQGTEAIFLVPAPDTVNRALQLVTVNNQRLTLLGDIGNLYSITTLEVGGADAVGMVLPIPWHILNNPNSEFAQTSRQLWGGDVNWATAMTYDATQVLIAALQQNPTREGIQQALASQGFSASGIQGPIQFTPAGDGRGSMQLIQVQPANPSRSGTGYDFVPL